MPKIGEPEATTNKPNLLVMTSPHKSEKHESNRTNDNSEDEGNINLSPQPLASPTVAMMPMKGLDMILQLLQAESE